MKTDSEVAEEIVANFHHAKDIYRSQRLVQDILTFAEKRVQEERAKPIYGPSVIEALEMARTEGLVEAAKEIPSTWLDPLLSGEAKVSELPWNCHEIELFCKKLVERICALKEKP